MIDPAQYYPSMIVPVGHVEPVPRRLRGYLGSRPLFDTQRALYVWEWPGYPQFAIPLRDVVPGALVDEDHVERLGPGPARRHGIRTDDGVSRPRAAWVWTDGAPEALAGTVTFKWSALDAWFEEDEEVFVHPRSPYSRVDAIRSARDIRVELDGVVLAEAPCSVMVFETGLPTRYYLDRTHVDFTRLQPSDTATACPYKGRTTGYWSAGTDSASHRDIAWSYDFPTRQLAPIAGLVAFFNEKVDIFLDGELLPRPAVPQPPR